MAALGASVYTLADIAKTMDPEGKVAKVIELLSQTNEMLEDMMWKEGNLPTGHRVTVRTGLPTVAWRLLNQGVTPSKSTKAQIDEQCGILEAWCEVDKDLALLNGNTAEFRLSEAFAFIEAMNIEMQSTLLYGNSAVDPEKFTGLSIRYSSLSANNARNIVSGGGSGSDNTSIWLIVWGENTIHGIYPKGSQAGLMHADHGEVTVETTAGMGGTRLRAYQDQYQWKCGVALKDWRYVARIPNIDVSNLVAKSSAADVLELMIKATHRVENLRMGRPAFYMNRTVMQMLDIMRRDDVMAGGGLTYENVDGKREYSFRGIPVRICDAILETEAAVS
jgi:hypothetical protein